MLHGDFADLFFFTLIISAIHKINKINSVFLKVFFGLLLLFLLEPAIKIFSNSEKWKSFNAKF